MFVVEAKAYSRSNGDDVCVWVCACLLACKFVRVWCDRAMYQSTTCEETILATPPSCRWLAVRRDWFQCETAPDTAVRVLGCSHLRPLPLSHFVSVSTWAAGKF